MSIRWRPDARDPLTVHAWAFAGLPEPYTLDFGGHDVRVMYPKSRPAAKTYPQAGRHLVVARTLESGHTAHTELVVRSYLTPRFSVEALSARRVRLRMEHPGGDPVLYQVNWGTDNTWADHGANELEVEYVYPATPGGPPTITVLDAPAHRSARQQAPVARRDEHGRDEPRHPCAGNVEVTVNVAVNS